MNLSEIEAKLLAMSEEGVKQSWSILDTQGRETFGLNFSRISQFARELGKDVCLADELYGASNHDMHVLATYIDDPDSYTRDELEKRSRQLYPSPFAERFCSNVLAKSPYAVHFIDLWRNSDDENYRAYAYMSLDALASNKNNLSDEFFADHVGHIAQHIHLETDLVKEAMSNALVSIGCRDAQLKKQTSKAAVKIGEVSFNDGSRLDAISELEKKLVLRKPVKE